MKSRGPIRPALSIGNHERPGKLASASRDRVGGQGAKAFYSQSRRGRPLIKVKTCCQLRGIRAVNAIPAVKERRMIRKVLLAAVLATFAVGSAMADDSCESKAMGKDGKPLAGAAKTSFMKKCMADSCATKAMSSDGKPLSGAAKNSFMKKCESGA
jgi:hypothetical protein